jgi:hypothetical protein
VLEEGEEEAYTNMIGVHIPCMKVVEERELKEASMVCMPAPSPLKPCGSVLLLGGMTSLVTMRAPCERQSGVTDAAE